MVRMPVDVTQVLRAANAGDPAAAADLLPLVYDELRRLARQRLAHEAPGQTLQATALVHEAYLRLIGDDQLPWNSRGHFFGAAARAMRRIIIERARKYHSLKHGGEWQRISLHAGSEPVFEAHAENLIELEESLKRLEAQDRRKADIVMLRYFAGLTMEQIAMALDLSLTTVKNEWRFARAWLHSELERRDAFDD